MAAFSNPAETLALLQSQPGGSALTAIAPLFIIMIIFYVLLFVPQQRRQKKIQQMQNELKAGDKVITSSGIYGTIVGVENDAVQLRIAETTGGQVRVRISRASIAGLQLESKES
jgi:preprotein translocase subunit YajC